MPKGIKKTTAVAVKPTATPVQKQEQASVETFIMTAIQQGLPVETMERLFSLREKVKAEQAHEAFVSAMGQFQAECPVIVKNKIVTERNSTVERYRFAPLDSMVTQVKEPLARNGFSYTIDTKSEGGFLTALVKITHVLGHSEVTSFQVPIDEKSYMSAPQKYASASTFAKRYAFMNALGILTGDEDTDAADLPGGAASSETAPPPAPKAPAKPVKKTLPLDNVLVIGYKRALETAKDMAELANVWASMPVEAKNTLEDVKNAQKAIISSAANETGNETA